MIGMSAASGQPFSSFGIPSKGMLRAIAEKKIPVHGTPYQVAQRAYRYEMGDYRIGITMERIFDEMDKRKDT
jgi:hypothetical protein